MCKDFYDTLYPVPLNDIPEALKGIVIPLLIQNKMVLPPEGNARRVSEKELLTYINALDCGVIGMSFYPVMTANDFIDDLLIKIKVSLISFLTLTGDLVATIVPISNKETIYNINRALNLKIHSTAEAIRSGIWRREVSYENY